MQISLAHFAMSSMQGWPIQVVFSMSEESEIYGRETIKTMLIFTSKEEMKSRKNYQDASPTRMTLGEREIQLYPSYTATFNRSQARLATKQSYSI